MDATRRFLASMGLPSADAHDLPSSSKRFPDGAQYRVELPSTEGPAAPVYIKFGLRNAPNIYPVGGHIASLAVALSRERVHRAKLGLDILHRLSRSSNVSVRSARPGVAGTQGYRR